MNEASQTLFVLYVRLDDDACQKLCALVKPWSTKTVHIQDVARLPRPLPAWLNVLPTVAVLRPGPHEKQLHTGFGAIHFVNQFVANQQHGNNSMRVAAAAAATSPMESNQTPMTGGFTGETGLNKQPNGNVLQAFESSIGCSIGDDLFRLTNMEQYVPASNANSKDKEALLMRQQQQQQRQGKMPRLPV